MEIARYTLSAAERAVFEDHCAAPDAREADDLRRDCAPLATALREFRDGVNDAPLIVVSGLPCKEAGDAPTPRDRRNPPGMDQRTERSIALCAALMEIRIRVAEDESFPFNTPFHHVIPQREHVETPAVNNGAGDFPFHQDRIFLDVPPDYHLLACVRVGNDPCATSFMDTRPVLADLPAEIAAVLRRREFEDPATGKRVPVLREGRRGACLGVDLQPGWMIPVTDEAARALDYLRQASNRIAEDDIASILIGPGELVIHDHHRLMHGRQRFNPDFDRPETVRWLIRAHALA